MAEVIWASFSNMDVYTNTHIQIHQNKITITETNKQKATNRTNKTVSSEMPYICVWSAEVYTRNSFL